MTALGIQVVWLAARVAVVALISALLVWWSARHAARSAVVVLAASMMVFLALSATAFLPVPDSCRWSPLSGTARPSSPDTDCQHPVALGGDAHAQGFELAEAWRLLSRPDDQAPHSDAWQLASAVLMTLYGFGMTIFALRLLAGWLAVMSLCRRSRPIHNTTLMEVADSLRGVLRYSGPVDFRECSEPALAATVGWLRPVIFLPPEWLSWTEIELRAVIAHELSHVWHRDYLIGLLTRLCQAIHFYNPLLHWLSAQLRWQQELAADELVASEMMDRNQYLKALASLALRSPTRMSVGAMPWSAMTGGTLLRRIHMLQGTRNARPLSWVMRGLSIGVLIGLGVLLTSLGGSATQIDQRKEKNAEPFEIGYLPPDAKGFVAIRPTFLLRQPGMDKVARQIVDGLLQLKKMGITVPDALKPENIEELVVDFQITSQGTGKPQSRGLVVGGSSLYVRLNQDFDWPAFFKKLSKEVGALINQEGFEVTELRGSLTYRLGAIPMLSPVPIHFHMPDKRTIVFSGIAKKADDPQAGLNALRQMIGNVARARQRDWGGYDKVARAPIAAVLDTHAQQCVKILAKDIEPNELKILENIRFAAVGIEIGDGRPVRLILDAKSAAAAQELERTVDLLAQTMPDKIKQANPGDEHDKIVLRLASELLESRKSKRDGARVEVVGFSSVRIHELFHLRDDKSPKASNQ